jgi:hypothetical protein
MTNQHIITVPPELAQKCWDELRNQTQLLDSATGWDKAIALAYQAGADQELEAGMEWFRRFYKGESWMLRDLNSFKTARRPKPPSLKEQALEQLREVNAMLQFQTTGGETSAIRRAIEALPND